MPDAKDRISAINDSVATNINNLGKIDLKKGPASSGLNILNIDGAMMAVWKRITPQIKPETSIWIFSNIFKNPLKNFFYDSSFSNISKYINSKSDLLYLRRFSLSFFV